MVIYILCFALILKTKETNDLGDGIRMAFGVEREESGRKLIVRWRLESEMKYSEINVEGNLKWIRKKS